MVAIKAFPFDSEVTINPDTGQEEYDRVAHARDLADWLAAYFSNGILVRGTDLLTNELQVLHLSAMACVVKPGIIVINGRTGFLEAQETIEFAVGESNPRVDRVVAELNMAERNIYIKILKGTAASSPQPPGIIQTEDIYQIPLAQVRINANSSVISSVLDERAGYISNVLLNKAPETDVEAGNIKISEAVRNLYGLTVDNATVDKALQALRTYHVETITASKAWVSPITGHADVFLCAGGGGGGCGHYWAGGSGGGGGGCLFTRLKVTAGQQIQAIIGAGGAGGIGDGDLNGKPGGDTSFGGITVAGGKGGGGNEGNGNNASPGGDGASGGAGSNGGDSKYTLLNGCKGGENGTNGGETGTADGKPGGKGCKSYAFASHCLNPLNGILYGSGGGSGGTAKGQKNTAYGGPGGSGGGSGGNWIWDGTQNYTNPGGNGLANRGGGGGGGSGNKAWVGIPGGTGGSGIIMVGYYK